MVNRVASLFFALLLCWFGVATPDPASARASSLAGHVEVGLVVESPQAVHEGTVHDRQLDDQSGDAQVDGVPDLPALVMAPPVAAMPFLTMPRPAPYARAAWLSPYLDGPQRPPRATRIVV